MANYDDMSDDELWDEMERSNNFEKGQILFELGRRKAGEHEHLQSLAYFSQAADVYRNSTFEREYGIALLYKGNAHHAIEEYQAAIDLYIECALITKTLGSDSEVALVEHNTARSYAELGLWADAARHSGAAEHLYVACEIYSQAADAAMMNGGMHRRMGDYHEAVHSFLRAHQHAAGLESIYNAYRAIRNLAQMYIATGLYDDAISNAREALHLGKTCACPQCVPDSQLLLAQALIGAQQYEVALQYLEKAHSTYNSQSKAGEQGICLLEIGRCQSAMGHPGARETLEEAQSILRTVNRTHSLSRTISALADLDSNEGKLADACQKLQQAYDLICDGQHEATKQEIWLKLVKAYWRTDDGHSAQSLLQEYEDRSLVNHDINVQRFSTQCEILLSENKLNKAVEVAESALKQIHPGDYSAQEAIFHMAIGRALRHSEPARAERENAKAVACFLAAGDVDSATSISHEHFIQPDKTLAAIVESEAANSAHAQDSANSDFDSHLVIAPVVIAPEQDTLNLDAQPEATPDNAVGTDGEPV
jgi:tetratricopeptide (TPR) repeat protein